jgi:hypothetical protein
MNGYSRNFANIFGLLMLIRPTLIWTITESWKSNDATEPSNMYILSSRLGGVICTLIGIGWIIAYSLS